MVLIGSRTAIVEVEPAFPAQATTRDDCPFGVGQIPSLMELRRAIQVPGDSGSHQPKLVTVVSTGAAGTASSPYFSAPPNTISDRRNKKLNLRLSRLGWGRPMRDGAVSLCSIRLSAKDVVSLLLVADHVIGYFGGLSGPTQVGTAATGQSILLSQKKARAYRSPPEWFAARCGVARK